MIVFDLRCGGGHVFEAWFGATADYEAQRTRGLVACPLCGTTEVTKALMAPRLSTGKAESARAFDPSAVKAGLAALAKGQAKMLESSDWVGRAFAEEARAIHHGEQTRRSIHGEASRSEVAGLIDDGIGVAPLPFPVVRPAQSN